MAIDPTSSDPFEGPLVEESMAEIYAMLGDADHAIPILKNEFRFRHSPRSLPRCCESAPSGIRFAMILAFRNWWRKRNCESKGS